VAFAVELKGELALVNPSPTTFEDCTVAQNGVAAGSLWKSAYRDVPAFGFDETASSCCSWSTLTLLPDVVMPTVVSMLVLLFVASTNVCSGSMLVLHTIRPFNGACASWPR
jgi:hypothetical protein